MKNVKGRLRGEGITSVGPEVGRKFNSLITQKIKNGLISEDIMFVLITEDKPLMGMQRFTVQSTCTGVTSISYRLERFRVFIPFNPDLGSAITMDLSPIVVPGVLFRIQCAPRFCSYNLLKPLYYGNIQEREESNKLSGTHLPALTLTILPVLSGKLKSLFPLVPTRTSGSGNVSASRPATVPG